MKYMSLVLAPSPWTTLSWEASRHEELTNVTKLDLSLPEKLTA